MNAASSGFSIIHWFTNDKNTPLTSNVTTASQGCIFSFVQERWGCQFSMIPASSDIFVRTLNMNECNEWSIK